MRVVRNKLREESGASLIMGLVFFLVCLMVGSVVLTASTAAAGKLAEQQEYEQNYLTVSSAAQLLKNRIGALKFEQIHKEKTVNDGLPEITDTPLLEETISGTGTIILRKELADMGKVLAPPSSPPATPGEKTFQIYKQTTPSEDIVYGSMKMEPDGRILVKLWLETVIGGTPQKHNQVEIEFSPDGPSKNTQVEVSEEAGNITKIVTVTTTCSWPAEDCIIRKGTA